MFACFAVVVANLTVKGNTGFHVNDYFIVADCPDKRSIVRLGFYYSGKRRLFIKDMTPEEVKDFKLICNDFKLVISNEEGRVYETPKWSFKEYYQEAKALIEG